MIIKDPQSQIKNVFMMKLISSRFGIHQKVLSKKSQVQPLLLQTSSYGKVVLVSVVKSILEMMD